MFEQKIKKIRKSYSLLFRLFGVLYFSIFFELINNFQILGLKENNSSNLSGSICGGTSVKGPR